MYECASYQNILKKCSQSTEASIGLRNFEAMNQLIGRFMFALQSEKRRFKPHSQMAVLTKLRNPLLVFYRGLNWEFERNHGKQQLRETRYTSPDT